MNQKTRLYYLPITSKERQLLIELLQVQRDYEQEKNPLAHHVLLQYDSLIADLKSNLKEIRY